MNKQTNPVLEMISNIMTRKSDLEKAYKKIDEHDKRANKFMAIAGNTSKELMRMRLKYDDAINVYADTMREKDQLKRKHESLVQRLFEADVRIEQLQQHLNVLHREKMEPLLAIAEESVYDAWIASYPTSHIPGVRLQAYYELPYCAVSHKALKSLDLTMVDSMLRSMSTGIADKLYEHFFKIINREINIE